MHKDRKARIGSPWDLIIWQRSMELANATSDLTEPFPDRERYGLVSQRRRAGLSIPANIAEGQGRSTTRDLLRFLGIAKGSFRELDTYCDFSEMRRYATGPELQDARRLIERQDAYLSLRRPEAQAPP
jgi:four helix bundle protein